jgi:hypothetical protein
VIQLKWQWAMIGPVAAFLIGLLCSGPNATHESHVTHESQLIRMRLDTAHSTVTVPIAAIRARGASNRVRTIAMHDTIFAEHCLDTLLQHDTLQTAPDTLSVCFARNVFSVFVAFSPRRKEIAVPYIARDTFYSREDTVRIAASEKRSWYEEVLTVLVSVAAGVVIAKL